MLPRAEALTASSLRSRQINSSSNSRAKQRPFQGRPRSLSETSDSTIVPATFAKEAKAAREGRVSSSTNVSVAQANYDSDVSSRLATSTQATSASSTKSQDSASSRSLRRTLSEGPHRQSVEIQTLSPRALQTMLVSLQLLSLVPAIVGASYCIYRAISPPTRTVTYSHGLVKTLRWTQRIEWLLCAMWAGLSGNYCHSMARGLTRRWLVYYPLPAAIIRLVSLQVICWPLTKFTVVNFFGKDELQLPAWIVCAITAAISNTVQIWVTSNLRFLLVSGASSHPASWASRLPAAQRRNPTPPSSISALIARNAVDPLSNALPPDFTLPRGLRSKQVIKQTVLPIATCSFCTLLWALVEVYSMRGSRLHILGGTEV